MGTLTTERHASDGELVALLDRELEIIGDVAAHVDTCAACSARLALVWNRTARLSEALAAATPPTADADRLRPRPEQLARARAGSRRRVWSRPWLRAAAGIVLVAGIAAATPARAWIIERVTGRASWSAPPERRAAPTGVPAPPAGQSSAPIISFTPEAEELVIRFSARAAGGSLTLVAGDGRRSSAQIVDRGAGEAFLVLPSELRIHNEPSSVADYQVTLSPAVRRVRVRLGATAADEIASVEVTPGMRRVIQLAAAEKPR